MSYEFTWIPLLASVGAALLAGFGLLGWRQVRALEPYFHNAYGAVGWVAVTALTWVPATLAFLGYGAFLQWLVVNIYPEQHGLVKLLAAEVALLCPSLAAFAFIARRTLTPAQGSPQPLPQPRLPATTLAGLLVPPLAVVLAFGALLVGEELRVERTWVAGGSAGYLSVGPNGQVETYPPANEAWNLASKLSDVSPDGSMLAQVERDRVAIYPGADAGGEGGRTPLRTIEVFSGPPPADYYADDVINVVRFSPDGALLAAGTGRATEGDSFVNSSNDHAVHVWSVADGTPRYTLTDPQYSVRALAWSPSGKYLAAGGGLDRSSPAFDSDNIIRVWRLDGGRDEVNTHPVIAFALKGHTSAIEALAWSPDGSRLVSRDLSGRIVIWRIE